MSDTSDAVEAAKLIVQMRDDPAISVHRYIDYMRNLDAGTIVSIARALLLRESEREWQPIETAPKDGTRFLIWVGWWDGARTEIGYWDGIRWVAHTEGGEKTPAHVDKWQALPSPPALSVKE